MVKAIRVQEKAAGVGFDWKAAEPVLDKIKEEITEFEAEQKRQDITAMEVNLAMYCFPWSTMHVGKKLILKQPWNVPIKNLFPVSKTWKNRLRPMAWPFHP